MISHFIPQGPAILICAPNQICAKQSRSLWPKKCWPVTLGELSEFDAARLCQRVPSSKAVVDLAGTYWAGHVWTGSALAKWNFKECQRAPPFPYTTWPGWSCFSKLPNTNWFEFAGLVYRFTLVSGWCALNLKRRCFPPCIASHSDKTLRLHSDIRLRVGGSQRLTRVLNIRSGWGFPGCHFRSEKKRKDKDVSISSSQPHVQRWGSVVSSHLNLIQNVNYFKRSNIIKFRL